MRVGIVTFHASRNYGAALQAFALQSHLERMGHQPFFVNYEYQWDVPLPGLIRSALTSQSLDGLKLNDRVQRKIFGAFQTKYLKIGGCRYRDRGEVEEAPPAADAYVCGSDQVWSPRFVDLKDEFLVWLQFGDRSVKRVSYAASFGTSRLDAAVASRWKAYAARLDSVSVREADAVELVKGLGRNDAVWVPDPTLLVDRSAFDVLRPATPADAKPYCFSYQLGTDSAALSRAVEGTVEATLKVATMSSRPQSLRANVVNNGFYGPNGWISRIANAAFVVTNSFHGVAFSLIFRRPFLVLLRSEINAEMNSRICSLLKVAGLQHRSIDRFDPKLVRVLCRENIDWPEVDRRVDAFRDVGHQFLLGALT